MQDTSANLDMSRHTYAGFGIRLGAWLIDFVILTIVGLISGLLGGLGTLVSVVLTIAYEAGFESSHFQATPGKMVCGLIVTDINGQRVSFARALARNWAMSISNLTLGFGYLMITSSPKRQGLHDKIANCLVLKKTKVLGCGGERHPADS